MADGWASFCTLADPIAAWQSVYSPERVAVIEPILGGVSAIIAPFAYLEDVGTSATLGAELEAIRTAAASVRRRGLSLHDDGTETAKDLDAHAANVERMRHAATMAEKLALSLGWKYDADSGRMTQTRKGSRGRDLLRECARRIYAHQYATKGNTAAVRQKISRELSTVFDASELSPASGALIFEAIRYHENSRKQIPCKR